MTKTAETVADAKKHLDDAVSLLANGERILVAAGHKQAEKVAKLRKRVNMTNKDIKV